MSPRFAERPLMQLHIFGSLRIGQGQAGGIVGLNADSLLSVAVKARQKR